MTTQEEKIRIAIEPFRKQLINHPLYSAVHKTEDLHLFMQYHVFAVWDFMSLLKSLQNTLTCTNVPWLPKTDTDTCYLINEIVLGEETDVDNTGKRQSHFEIYLNAMKQAGARTKQLENFIKAIQQGLPVREALEKAMVPVEVMDFVLATFDVINSNKPYIQAAVFTFGREDLIPTMFISIVQDIAEKLSNRFLLFHYYLQRHIEVDGGQHSHLALQMTANLCGQNTQYWAEAEAAIINALQKRITLWDAVYKAIQAKNRPYADLHIASIDFIKQFNE